MFPESGLRPSAQQATHYCPIHQCCLSHGNHWRMFACCGPSRDGCPRSSSDSQHNATKTLRKTTTQENLPIVLAQGPQRPGEHTSWQGTQSGCKDIQRCQINAAPGRRMKAPASCPQWMCRGCSPEHLAHKGCAGVWPPVSTWPQLPERHMPRPRPAAVPLAGQETDPSWRKRSLL